MRWLGKQAKLRSWSPGTLNRWQAALSLTFRRAMMSDILDRNPLALTQRQRESDNRTRYLDYAEEALLRGIAQRRCVHSLRALDIALHTGIRSGEQFSIRWWQVDRERKLLFIPKNLSKNKKGPHIQLNAVALSAFNSLLAKSRAKSKSKQVKPDDYACLNWSGCPLRGHRDWLDAILKEARVPDVTWHCLRHTFGSRLIVAGAISARSASR
jgi:site-specific recombinase XerD